MNSDCFEATHVIDDTTGAVTTSDVGYTFHDLDDGNFERTASPAMSTTTLTVQSCSTPSSGVKSLMNTGKLERDTHTHTHTHTEREKEREKRHLSGP